MVLLALPVDIVGGFVTFAENKMVFVEKCPQLRPGNRLVIESMSLGWLALENKGERAKTWFVGLLLLRKILPLSTSAFFQESRTW